MIDLQNKRLENINNISIPISHSIIRKRKRRFIYYFLCILLSFISIRIILILYAISNFKFSEFRVKTISYDMKDFNTLFLDIEFPKVYSPLHVQLCQAECMIDSGSYTLNRVAEINIPNIELGKYKGVEIAGNFNLTYVNPTHLINILKKRKNVVITCTCDIWFRFCFIKIKMSPMFTHFLDFEKNKSTVDNFPFTIRTISTKYKKMNNEVDDEFIETTFEIESYNVQIPSLLKIKTYNSQFLFTNDLPIKIRLKEIDIENGVINKPIIFSFEIKKEDINTILESFNKFYKRRNLNIGFHQAFVNNQPKDLKPFNLIVKHSLFYNNDQTRNCEHDQEFKKPFLSIKDIEFKKKILKASLFLDLNLYPIITKYTLFKYDFKDPLNFNLKLNNEIYGIINIEPIKCKEFIKLKVNYKFPDKEMILIDIQNKKMQISLDQAESKSFFSLNCKFDFFTRETIVKINDMVFTSEKSKNDKPVIEKSHVVEHLISSNDSDVIISSYLNLNYINNFLKYVYIQIPNIKLQISNELIKYEILLFANNYRIDSEGRISGIFNLLSKINALKVFNYLDLLEEIKTSSFKVNFVNMKFSYDFKIIYRDQPKNNCFTSDSNIQDKIFDLRKYKFSFEEINKDLDFKFRINPIENIFKILDENFNLKNNFIFNQNLIFKIIPYNDLILDQNNIEFYVAKKKFSLYYINGNYKFICEGFEIKFNFKSCSIIKALVQNNYTIMSCSNHLSYIISNLFCNLEKKDTQTFDKFLKNEILNCNIMYKNYLSEKMNEVEYFTDIKLSFDISDKLLEKLVFNEFSICEQKIEVSDFYTDCVILTLQNEIINYKYGKKLELKLSFADSIDKLLECKLEYKNLNNNNIWTDYSNGNNILSVFRAFSSFLYAPSEKEDCFDKNFPIVNIDFKNLKVDELSKNVYIYVDLIFESIGWKKIFNSLIQNFLSTFYSFIPEFINLELDIPHICLFTLGSNKERKDMKYNVLNFSFIGEPSTSVYTLNCKNNIEKNINYDIECKIVLHGNFLIEFPCSEMIEILNLNLYSPVINGISTLLKNENPSDIYKKFSFLSKDFLCDGKIIIFLGFNLCIEFKKNLYFDVNVNNDLIGKIHFCDNQDKDGYLKFLTTHWHIHNILIKYLELKNEKNYLSIKCFYDNIDIFQSQVLFSASIHEYFVSNFLNNQLLCYIRND